MTTATETVAQARRTAAQARAYLDTHAPISGLDRALAEQLLGAVGDLVAQLDELNRIIFDLESEAYYADEAALAPDDERGPAPAWLSELQEGQPQPRPPIPGIHTDHTEGL